MQNTLLVLTLVLGSGLAVVAGDKATIAGKPAESSLPLDTYSGYFVSNKFEPDAAESFVVIQDQKRFDQVFGVAMVMRDKSHRLAKDAFDANLVLAVVKRGKAFWEYQVTAATVERGVVELRYTAKAKASDSATFACPLIVSIPKGKYAAFVFVENGKKVKTLTPSAGG
jgi:hypothetical protein